MTRSTLSLLQGLLLGLVLGFILSAIPSGTSTWPKIQTAEDLRNLVFSFSALVGVVLLLWRTYAVDKSATAAENQASIADRNLITDRFASAAEHLGSEGSVVRIGYIYAMESIAFDSDKYYWPVMELLATHLRLHSATGKNEVLPGAERTGPSRLRATKAEVEAVLRVIGRIRRDRDNWQGLERGRIDLRGVDFAEADIDGVNLVNALLSDSDLSKTWLCNANLEGANLDGTNLEGAILNYANMKRASLIKAKLRRAQVERCNLQQANLFEGDIREAVLTGSDLQDSNLQKVACEQAVLLNVKLNRAKVSESIGGCQSLDPEELNKAEMIADEPVMDMLRALADDYSEDRRVKR